jgi:hypothetical protein
MITLPFSAYQCLSYLQVGIPELIEDIPENAYLEPMTLRFVKVDKNEVVCQQVVGPKAGKITTSFFNRVNMWHRLLPLIPHLHEITEKTGTVIHVACLCSPTDKAPLRQPFLLVETSDLNEKAAANWSKRHFFASRNNDAADAAAYLDYISERNALWLKQHEIMPSGPDETTDFKVSLTDQKGTLTIGDLKLTFKITSSN